MIAKDLVLLGGGHSHVEVLRAFGQQARLSRQQGGLRDWFPPQLARSWAERPQKRPQQQPQQPHHQHHQQQLQQLEPVLSQQAEPVRPQKEVKEEVEKEKVKNEVEKQPELQDAPRGGAGSPKVAAGGGSGASTGHRLILISRDRFTPYSGMLPGWASGFYSYGECHIDLQRLASYAGARLVLAEATGVDIRARTVCFDGSDGSSSSGGGCAPAAPPPPVPYDVLSIDVGITPGSAAIPGADRNATPVKPIDGFARRYEQLLQRYRETAAAATAAAAVAAAAAPRRSEFPGSAGASKPVMRVCVVGGGAGGVELAAAVRYRLEEERRRSGWAAEAASASISLLCRGELLPGHPPHVRRLVRQLLTRRGVEIRSGDAVVGVEPRRLLMESGGWVLYDECLWCTDASPALWLRQTGLPTDPAGFLAINDRLQSAGGPSEVFAAGDVATSEAHPRPKAGVFAVRQGPPLAYNLRAFLEGRPLQPFVPQETALALISLGDRFCVASRTGGPSGGSSSGRSSSSGSDRAHGLASPNSSDGPGGAGGSAGTCYRRSGRAPQQRPQQPNEDEEENTAAAAAVAAVAAGESEWALGWLLNGCGGLFVGLTGPLLWRWKDAIDRAFMRKYGDDLDVDA